MKLFALTPTQECLRDLSVKVWKRQSGDPAHPDNAGDADFQAGYLLGRFTTDESFDDINTEWEARDKPDTATQADDTAPERGRTQRWRSWKAGYWAGRMSRL